MTDLQIDNTKELKNFTTLNGSYNCPLVVSYEKKDLQGNDFYTLRYMTMRFIRENQSNIYEFMDIENSKELFNNVDEQSSICDNSLYLGDFEGYQIDNDLYLHDLELDVNNRIILTVLDNAQDKFYSYLID